MPLAPGQTLGHYRIVAPLGAGGMGEVYRATDTRLGRDVAIKSLPAELAADADRLARFRREAQVLASLNHPNIAAIHGLEEIDGRSYLMLELAEGETLAARLARGPIPVPEAVDLAAQIAQGLEEAHEKGIVHRDLKPANVAVTPDGKVKILDFGLAKALEEDPIGGRSDLTQSPTLTGLGGTRAGVILGTASYMSPEQARGKPVDKRSDNWAFGAVLYEMLTGQQAFGGETVSDILAAVLTRETPLDALPESTPGALRRLIGRCLERDPKRRLRDIGEARIALQEIAAGGAASHSGAGLSGAADSDTARAGAAAGRGGLRVVPLALGAVVLAALALYAGFALGTRRAAAPPADNRTVRFAVPAPAGVDAIWQPAVAPDGSFVVFEGNQEGKSALYLHRFDELTTTRIEGGDGGRPFLSPDGRWIGFVRGFEIRKVAVSGGESILVGKTVGGFPRAAWGPDGSILFPRAWLSGFSILSANGGEARPLTTPDAAHGEKGHWWPRFLPDGRHAIFTIWRSGSGLNDASIALLDVTTGSYRTLFSGADAWYRPPGQIIFYRAGTYHAIPFDAATLQVKGEPVPFLREVPVLDPDGDYSLPLGIGADGTVVYSTSQDHPVSQLAWVAPGRKPEPLPVPPRRYIDTDLSPDGETLAVSSLEGGQFEIHLLDLRAGTEQRLEMPGSNWTVMWNPRGPGLAYRSMRKGDFDAYLTDVAGGGSETPLLTGDSDQTLMAWAPDGHHLIYEDTMEGSRGTKLMQVPPDGEPLNLGDWQVEAGSTTVSPDGRWVVYESSQSGRSELYVRPFPGPGPATRITRDGGGSPRFARGGELFFRKDDRILRQAYGIEAGHFVPREERTVVEAPLSRAHGLTVGPDGRRFLVPLRVSDTPPPQLQILMSAAAAPVAP
ncbi:MAG TPA: protein kinase [Verrucomicrobiae bacterium]|nr:protein kinase [Verrucomicrobiae bacterium]